jgi:TatD DNase family protein
MHISDFLPKTGLFDSHCHLIYKNYDKGNQEIIEDARKAEISALFNTSTDIESSKKVHELVESSNGYIKSFIGIDPQEVIPNPDHFMGLNVSKDQLENMKSELRRIYLQNPSNIIGIGETGMDFYWIKNLDTQTQEKSKILQKQLFEIHIELAEEFKIPLTIHSRSAESECLEVLKSNLNNSKGIFHSFTGTYDQATAILDSGHGLGVNGIFTFKNADSLREVYRKILGKVPRNATPEYFYNKGIFFETDSPFLAPEGKRGEVNYPANVALIYKNFVEVLST